MLDSQQILAAAAHLDRAERSREQVRQFSLDYPGMTRATRAPRGWLRPKVGASSRVRSWIRTPSQPRLTRP